MLFYGDSYMRHIYAAMLITLSGNFKDGSLANPESTPHCRYQTQFSEKSCNTFSMNHNGRVCGGKIHLDPLLTGFSEMRECSKQNGTVALWSFGNHQLSRGRVGINNATAFSDFFSQTVCPLMKEAKVKGGNTGAIAGTCSVWWVSTHQRLVAHYEDEVPERVLGYNLGMRKYFDEDNCGNVNYVDVYNMTEKLTQNHTDLAKQHMSFDHVHWGMESNLQKAQIILNGLLSSPA